MTGMPTQEDYEKFSDRDPGSRRQSCIQSENEEIFRQVLRNVANGQPLTSPSKKSGHERKNTTVSAPAKFTPGTPSELPSGGVSVASPPNQLINQHSLGLRVDVSELSHSRRTPIVQDNLVHLTTPTSLQRIGLLNRNPSTTRSNSREAATGAYQISPLAPNGNSRAIQSISSIAYPDPNASLSRSSSGSSSGNGLLEALRRVQEGSPTPHAKTSIQQQRIITQTPLSQRSVSPIYGPLEFHPIPEEVQKVRSNWLNQLTGPNGQPTVEGMLHPANIPFIETCHLTNRANNGVVCITNVSLMEMASHYLQTVDMDVMLTFFFFI
ncbi:hypothetical protein F5Y11DRAFT_105695 [Daldinia sp. FL1419]|nr:hypothetical protein F5Y11DRAFT_105695 [Daldinia sp. FL1419]